MRVIYEDEHIIVCHKEAGEMSEGETDRCLPCIISSYLKEQRGTDAVVYPVHRLDKETEGLIVYALNKNAAAALSEDIKEGHFAKEYLALCHGVPDMPGGALSDLLYYDRKRGKSFVVTRERAGVKKALLEYEVINRAGDLSQLKIKLHTGRTHQIRVQLASRGHCLAGDRRYGAPKDDGYKNIALLSHRLSFSHPKTKEVLEFTAESDNVKI